MDNCGHRVRIDPYQAVWYLGDAAFGYTMARPAEAALLYAIYKLLTPEAIAESEVDGGLADALRPLAERWELQPRLEPLSGRFKGLPRPALGPRGAAR